VVAVGLDATHQVRATPARVAAVRAVGSRAALAAVDLLEFSNALPANGPREQGAPLHDPCPIAWLLRPEAFKFRPCHVDVETRSTLTLGHTAVEFRAAPQRPQNVLWAVSADGDAVFGLLTATLADDALRAAQPR
jgi:purine nucleosidase